MQHSIEREVVAAGARVVRHGRVHDRRAGEEARAAARGGLQHLLGLEARQQQLGHATHQREAHGHRQAVDVEVGQRAEHRVAGPRLDGQPRADLGRVGQQVAVAEGGELGHAGGPAGRLEDRGVLGPGGRRHRAGGRARQQGRQGGRLRAVRQRLPAALAPRLQGVEPADRSREHLVDADADDRRARGLAPGLGAGGRDARVHQVERQRQRGGRLLDQLGQLALGVERVHRHGDPAGPVGAEQPDDERRAGRQVQAHALAAAQPEPGQGAREAVDRVVELGEGGARAQEVQRHPVRVALGRAAGEAVERPGGDLDLAGDAPRRSAPARAARRSTGYAGYPPASTTRSATRRVSATRSTGSARIIAARPTAASAHRRPRPASRRAPVPGPRSQRPARGPRRAPGPRGRGASSRARRGLGAQQRALGGEEVDGEVGEVRENLLLLLEPGAEALERRAGAAAARRSAPRRPAPPRPPGAPRPARRRRPPPSRASAARSAGPRRSRRPCVARLSERPRHQEPVDLVGPLPDAVDARVAVGPLGGELGRVAVAPVHLDELVHGPVELLAAQDLGDRALDRVLLQRGAEGLAAGPLAGGLQARVEHPRDAVGDRLDGVGAGRHAGQLGRDQREADDRTPEGLALAGVRQGLVQRPLHPAQGRRRQLEAADVEDVEGDLVALAGLAEQGVGGHDDAVEHHRAGGAALDAHLVLLGADGQPGRLALNQEGGDAAVLQLGVEREQVGEARVGDELLGAVQAVAAVRQPGRGGAHRAGVGAGAGLGERVGADRGARRQSGQIPGALLLGAEEDQGQGADPGVGEVGDGERVGGGQRLADDHRGDRVEAGPAMGLGHLHAHVAVGAEGREQLAVGRVVLALDRIGPGVDLGGDELAHGLADRAVLLAEALGGEDRLRGCRRHEEGAAGRGRLGGRHQAASSICTICSWAAEGWRPPSHSMTPAAPWPPPTHMVTRP